MRGVLLEDIEGEDLDLRPTTTMLQDPPDEFRGMIRVGQPVVFDACAYAEASGVALDAGARLLAASNRFALVRLPISIRPRERASVRFLAVECVLNSEGGTAVCWSMAPERVEQEITASSGAKITPELKVGVVTLGGEGSAEREFIVYQPNVLAFGIGETDPAWEFTPSKGRKLHGVQILHLLVSAPKTVSCNGTVAIRADVVSQRLLWNTKAVRRDDSQEVQRFDLG
jgi:hypothetical protein